MFGELVRQVRKFKEAALDGGNISKKGSISRKFGLSVKSKECILL